jgi:scyllo-inositol 2-dehydrogenase (NADP+)
MKILNVGMIGYGLSGSVFHAPIINNLPYFKLTHIVSTKKNIVSEPNVSLKILEEADLLFQSDDIDIIVITAPNQAHYSLAKKALSAKKHVILEKPFVVDSCQGKELIALAKKNHLILSVYHNRRWDNGFLTLKDILKEKILGNIYLYEAYFDRFRPYVTLEKWKEKKQAGAGILYDLGSHLLDQALCLFGVPHAIWADLHIQRQNAQAIDYFYLVLDYGKLRVSLGSSSIAAMPRPVLSVHGDKGSFVKYGLDPQEEQLKSGMIFSDPEYGIENEAFSGQLKLSDQDAQETQKILSLPGSYQTYYEKIYQCIVNKSENPVLSDSALKVIELIECAYLSAKEKRWIVLQGYL